MGLSRNKVAVSEGAAGSPPFYGEHERLKEITRKTHKENKTDETKAFDQYLLFDFQGLLETRYGGVAQLGEHLPCKQGVKGSIPFISTTATKVAEKKNVH